MGLKALPSRIPTLDTAIAKQPPKRADPFYLSPEWRALMERIIRTRGRRCEDPQHQGNPHLGNRRVFGDHIHELKDGGARLDPANVMLRCGSCHTRKTNEIRVLRHAKAPGGSNL